MVHPRCHFGMATVREREHSLHETLETLLHSGSYLSVYLNDYPKLKPWMSNRKYGNCEFLLAKDCAGDLGDAGKLYRFSESEADFFLTVDDDILYPSDYADSMTRWSQRLGPRAIVCAHGRVFPDRRTPIRTFFDQSRGVEVLHFSQAQRSLRRVHVGGSGAMCFHTKPPCPQIPYRDIFLKERNIADVWIATSCIRNGIPMFSVPRPHGWLRSTQSSQGLRSIYSDSIGSQLPLRIFNRELPSVEISL